MGDSIDFIEEGNKLVVGSYTSSSLLKEFDMRHLGENLRNVPEKIIPWSSENDIQSYIYSVSYCNNLKMFGVATANYSQIKIFDYNSVQRSNRVSYESIAKLEPERAIFSLNFSSSGKYLVYSGSHLSIGAIALKDK